MDYNEFADKIKAKYPDYADMDNQELAQKMVAKFPSDYGDVTFDQTQDQTSAVGFAGNVVSNMGRALNPINIAKGLGEQVYEGAYAIPRDIAKSTVQMAQGTPYSQTPIAQRATDISNTPQVQTPGKYAYENPIDAAMTVAAPILPFLKVPQVQEGAFNGLADEATKSASSRWFKAAGGGLPQAKELGADEALRIGRMAREKGYVTPTSSVEAQGESVSKALGESGKRLEELRGLGDLHGNSPEAMKIVQVIEQDLKPKYATGIRSGEVGDLNKAIQEVLKLEPIDKLTPGEELPSELDRAGQKKGQSFAKTQYERFRQKQEDPNYIPEYDLRRPTTFNEVSKVATDINRYAKSKSQLLQPSGADTEVANTVSRLNNDALLKVLPPEKGAEYSSQLKNYSDLSVLDRLNELKANQEVGGSRNRIVNNIANRIQHRFGYQLSAEALDRISGLLRKAPAKINNTTRNASKAVMTEFISRLSAKDQK